MRSTPSGQSAQTEVSDRWRIIAELARLMMTLTLRGRVCSVSHVQCCNYPFTPRNRCIRSMVNNMHLNNNALFSIVWHCLAGGMSSVCLLFASVCSDPGKEPLYGDRRHQSRLF